MEKKSQKNPKPKIDILEHPPPLPFAFRGIAQNEFHRFTAALSSVPPTENKFFARFESYTGAVEGDYWQKRYQEEVLGRSRFFEKVLRTETYLFVSLECVKRSESVPTKKREAGERNGRKH